MKKIVAIIPASGKGSRFGTSVPKQLHKIGNKLVIFKTLEIFDLNDIQKIYLTVNENILKNLLPLEKNINNKVEILLAGGKTRSETILNTLDRLANDLADDDWVIVHDAVRPFLDQKQLIEFIKVAKKSIDGAVMAIPATDTIKEVDDNLNIKNTLDRTKLWRAQTPQMFPYGLLKNALKNFEGIPTDESQAMEMQGHNPKIVLGDNDNIKITYPEDLKIKCK
jgi:2-C-methyl-D-erythritol 4-phosphate cytidylyltransferase